MYLAQSGMQKILQNIKKHLFMKTFYSAYCYKLFLRTTAEQVKTRVLNLSRDRRARIREKETMQRKKCIVAVAISINQSTPLKSITKGEGEEERWGRPERRQDIMNNATSELFPPRRGR